MARPALALVVAVARNGAIGHEGGLPWHVPEDLKHFRRVTLGHAIIMGRRTHESIGRPLPKRRNIVVSRDPDRRFEGCERAGSLEEAVEMARRGGDPMPMVIGGASLYAEALPRANRIYLTEVDREVEGDTFFPDWDRSAFREVERRPAAETPGVCFVILERT